MNVCWLQGHNGCCRLTVCDGPVMAMAITGAVRLRLSLARFPHGPRNGRWWGHASVLSVDRPFSSHHRTLSSSSTTSNKREEGQQNAASTAPHSDQVSLHVPHSTRAHIVYGMHSDVSESLLGKRSRLKHMQLYSNPSRSAKINAATS